MKAKRLSKAQQVSPDVISTLPQPIIETILCRLGVKEAARTSILSKDWRYKWTTIPKLVFDYYYMLSKSTSKVKQTSDITSARKNMDSRCKFFYDIHQVLLARQGPIHEFTLCMNADKNCYEIDQIISHLSRNHTVKKLNLDFDEADCYKLPLCFFSLHQLTHLHLCWVDLDHQPTFSGFSCLRTLYLYNVWISTKPLLHLLSNCPSLTSLTLLTEEGKPGYKDCTIVELFECLPMIEQLIAYGFSILPWLVVDSVPKELPTSLINLKYFRLEQMWFFDEGFPFLAILMKCSPNLEKISLQVNFDFDHESEITYGILEEYSDVWLEHLTELDIFYDNILNPGTEFVKFILARSPKLKKVWISSGFETDEELKEMIYTILRAPRASPLVDIVVV